MLGLLWKGAAVGALLRPFERVVAGGSDLCLAFRQIIRVELAGRESSAAGSERVAADRVAPRFRRAPPTPHERGWIARIREPPEQLLLILRVAGGQIHFARGPREFIVVDVMIAVEGDLLIRAVFAIFGDGIHQELPAEFCL